MKTYIEPVLATSPDDTEAGLAVDAAFVAKYGGRFVNGCYTTETLAEEVARHSKIAWSNLAILVAKNETPSDTDPAVSTGELPFELDPAYLDYCKANLFPIDPPIGG